MFLSPSILQYLKNIQIRKHIIVKNSKEEENFVAKLIEAIKELNTENIPDIEALKQIIQSFANTTDRIWVKNSKIVNITKHSKKWWNDKSKEL